LNKLDKALKKYYEYFDENYPLCISDTRNEQEIIEDIELCIDTGKVAEPIVYDEELDY
jgi:hypothetical protein